MPIFKHFSSEQSIYIQQLPSPQQGSDSQQRSPQVNQQTLMLLGSGLVILAIILSWWRSQQKHPSRQPIHPKRHSEPFDPYQSEFDCRSTTVNSTARTDPDSAPSAATQPPLATDSEPQ